MALKGSKMYTFLNFTAFTYFQVFWDIFTVDFNLNADSADLIQLFNAPHTDVQTTQTWHKQYS